MPDRRTGANLTTRLTTKGHTMTDNVEFNPQPATRKRVPALLALSGPSGSGKTYSALLLARGLVGPEGKILLIDTENRAEIYADDPTVNGFFRQELAPPFSSERYRAMIRAGEDWGADCVIVDSASHEHEGEGGMLDFADREEARIGGRAASRNKWIRPKADHNRFMNALRGARAHMILCIREKIIVDMEKKPPEKVGVPVCGNDLLFELLLHGRLDHDSHKCHWGKEPLPLAGCVPQDVVLTVEHGAALAKALSQGAEPDHELDAFLRNAEEKAREEGRAGLTEYWRSTPEAVQRRAKPHMGRIGQMADAADQARQSATSGQENEGA